MIGYRWYEKAGFQPAYPFGHGLSYGSFTYSNLSVVGRAVSFSVTLASGAGCDTAQLYLSAPTAGSDPAVPLKVLKYFQKVCDSTPLSFTVTDRDVSVWDVATGAWTVVPGTYGISIGSSSADIHLNGSLVV